MPLTHVVNNITLTSAMEDGSQTAEIRSVQASMYMNKEFVHGLPIKVAMELYQAIIDVLHADNKRNEIKQQEVSVLVHNLQIRAANMLNYDNLFGLSCIYWYLPGENPAMYDGAYDAQKMELFRLASADDRLFFCQKACEYTPQLKNQSDKDLEDYLNQTHHLITSQLPLTPKT